MVAWDRNPASSEEKSKQGLVDLAYGKAFSLFGEWQLLAAPSLGNGWQAP